MCPITLTSRVSVTNAIAPKPFLFATKKNCHGNTQTTFHRFYFVGKKKKTATEVLKIVALPRALQCVTLAPAQSRNLPPRNGFSSSCSSGVICVPES